jgi:uncharacterized membrane protein
MREDEARGSATVLLVAASVASLLGVGFALTLAGRASGPLQVLLIGVGVLAVVLSWTVVNTSARGTSRTKAINELRA